MQVVRALRLLPLPAAIALGTALALACGSGGPTSPDQVQAPVLLAAKANLVDDFGNPSLGDKDCPGGYSLISAEFTTGIDLDANGLVRDKNGGNGAGGKKK